MKTVETCPKKLLCLVCLFVAIPPRYFPCVFRNV